MKMFANSIFPSLTNREYMLKDPTIRVAEYLGTTNFIDKLTSNSYAMNKILETETIMLASCAQTLPYLTPPTGKNLPIHKNGLYLLTIDAICTSFDIQKALSF